MPTPPTEYPQFGSFFFKLLSNHLPSGSKANSNQIAAMLHFPRADVHAWLNGKIEGKRGLTPDRLLEILQSLIASKKHLLSYDDIDALVKLGREDYSSILRAPSIQDLLLVSLPKLDDRHPHIIRRELEQVFQQKLAEQPELILVYGPPGRGKKTLVQHAIQAQKSDLAYPTAFIHAETVEQLTDWVALLLSINQKQVPRGQSLLMEDFRRFYAGQRVLFIIYDCKEAEVVSLLQRYIPATCKLIVSTNDLGIVNAVLPDQRFYVPSFTIAETKEYLQAQGRYFTDQQIEAFRNLTLGNLLTTRIATSRLLDIDLEALLEALKVPVSPDPADELTGLHRAIRLGYESLPHRVKAAFVRIGVLPAHISYDLLTLRSLWTADGEMPLLQGEAKEILIRLVDQAGLANQVAADEWNIHPLIREFARSVGKNSSLEHAEQWLSIVLNDIDAQQEYETVLSQTYANWQATTSLSQKLVMTSPLPRSTPLPIRAVRSMLTASNVDTWCLLLKHRHLFSTREFRYLEFSRHIIRRKWRPYQFFAIFLFLIYVFSGFIKPYYLLQQAMIAFVLIGLIGILLYVVWHLAKEALRRDILMFHLWQGHTDTAGEAVHRTQAKGMM
jgi:hypothetical protein